LEKKSADYLKYVQGDKRTTDGHNYHPIPREVQSWTGLLYNPPQHEQCQTVTGSHSFTLDSLENTEHLESLTCCA